jgi:xanthine dehydrogenase iron-sulfur cluster and FAD-binding subunit A
MAVAKVALAGTAMLEGAIVREIRLAAASLAAFPARLYRTEDAICGKRLDAESIGAARAALLAEVLPIDDIRSTAEYRRGVAANLLGEFLNTLRAPDRRP